MFTMIKCVANGRWMDGWVRFAKQFAHMITRCCSCSADEDDDDEVDAYNDDDDDDGDDDDADDDDDVFADENCSGQTHWADKLLSKAFLKVK